MIDESCSVADNRGTRGRRELEQTPVCFNRHPGKSVIVRAIKTHRFQSTYVGIVQKHPVASH